MNRHPSIRNIVSESEMLALGRDFATEILASEHPSAVFELIGDVGAGKTTFTRGLAEGLGVREPVTSPSFTISKRYAFPLPEKCCKDASSRVSKASDAFDRESAVSPRRSRENYNTDTTPTDPSGQLIHYDFYRLDDPGIMRDELAEALAEPNSIIIVEWGSDVADLLPTDKIRLEIALCEDGSRTVKIIAPDSEIAVPTYAKEQE